MLTFEELLEKDNSFTIHHKNLQKLATEMYKVRNNISPPNIRNLFNEQTHKYSLRKEKIWENSNVHTVQWGIETITYRGPKIWDLVPTEIQKSLNLNIFKAKIKRWKPIGCTCRLCKDFVHDLGYI